MVHGDDRRDNFIRRDSGSIVAADLACAHPPDGFTNKTGFSVVSETAYAGTLAPAKTARDRRGDEPIRDEYVPEFRVYPRGG